MKKNPYESCQCQNDLPKKIEGGFNSKKSVINVIEIDV